MFIVFEGIDGSGKTTLSKRLAEELERRGRKVFLTYEPTNSFFGDVVRKSIEIGDPYLVTISFVLDRIRHVSEIRQRIENGFDVICDRYFYSTLAYQGAMLSGEMDEDDAIRWIEEIHKPFIIYPDYVFLIDISPREGLERAMNRGVSSFVNIFEKERFLESVRRLYLKLSTRYGMKILDGRLPTEDTIREIISILKL